MPLPVQPLSAVSEADLQALVAGGAREDRTLDFKRDAYGGSDDARAEFLADVSAFANTAGGDLIIGMDETDGAASALVGLAEGMDPDAEILRLQQMATAGLQPRVPNLDMAAVPLASGRHAIVVRVGRSYRPPHRVVFKNRNRFWVRGPAGRFEPDVDGLRALFNAAPALAERIRELRAERLGMILGGETPVPLHPARGTFILHIIPFSAVDGAGGGLDLSHAERDINDFTFPHASGLDFRINFDGFVTYRRTGDEGSYAYCQAHRAGYAEVVSVGQRLENAGDAAVVMDEIAMALLYHVIKLVPMLRRRGQPSPCAVILTLAGMKGARFASGTPNVRSFVEPPLQVGRDVLGFVDAVVPETANDGPSIALALAPILEQLAQSGGWRQVPQAWTAWVTQPAR